MGRQSQQDCRHTNENIIVFSLGRQLVTEWEHFMGTHSFTLPSGLHCPNGWKSRGKYYSGFTEPLVPNKLTPVRLCLMQTHVHKQPNSKKDCFLSMSLLKHFNCSLSDISATCKDSNILAHLVFPYIHICFDFLFNWELKNRRTMLVASGLAIRRTEMISKKFPVSTLSGTEVYKKRMTNFLL